MKVHRQSRSKPGSRFIEPSISPARRPRSAGRDQGGADLPHARVHTPRRRCPDGFVSRRSSATSARESVAWGAGVASLKKATHGHPLSTPECRQCKSCLSRQPTCDRDSRHAGRGLIPTHQPILDRKTRVHHYMAAPRFANFTCCRRSRGEDPRGRALRQVGYLGCA